MIEWKNDAGVVTLTMNDPDASANTMNDAYVEAMGRTVERLVAEKALIKGVIVTSAKSTFFAGGNLQQLSKIQPSDAAEVFDTIEEVKRQLRTLETLGVPVVAAINGSALGGGLEIALACHHRIVADDNRIELGVPEVTLGLLPGGGGVTRTVRMLGLQDALMKVLLQGQRMKPAHAASVGIVDEVVPAGDLLDAARRWISTYDGDAKQPWDRDGYKIPGGTPSSPKLAAFLPAFPANLRKQLKGAPYPAPRAIMSAAVEGSQVDFETASRIESRYFVSLATGQIAKNMIQVFFFDLQSINAGGSRPAGVPKYSARKVGVLGAGMMGAGIAYVCAKAGMSVVLKDVSLEAAARGKEYSEKLLAKQVAKGRSTAAEVEAFLSRITPTGDPNDLAGCDLVIEAVFEDGGLKQKVFAEIADVVEPDALLCSNTSTLPITALADGIDRPDDFIGMHFFSPVDRMPLVELIVGEKTSDRAIAQAYDVVRQIKKTPIVVNDSRGFFTSRVFGTLVMEGAAMVAEGVDPVMIERAATQAGFPAPPLAMLDEVTLTLPQKIRDAARVAGDSAGAFDDHPGMAVTDRLVNEFDRRGKAAGAGFYDYPADGPKQLWPGLREHFAAGADVSRVDLQERMLFAMALETVKCLDEGVLRSVPDANIGSIFGIGFPPLHGGALQYVNAYGVQKFAERARQLAATYGARFEPPALLDRKAAAGEIFG
ncbi:3-hydroxyacyl-CoA dehydrogenase/enoyl-CoA hydratase/3-hydroxybutyryl-CoA epimerase [Kribbella sp. VKM Ac-2569]|uniref:3-hydroxyacyl-CoA dehydrogenase NAD-binding domain-containing protein n=1 Tax=Kribbella sp. VKM Ac-2569 TaxID=2512220 RepID=UPI00102B3A73|nr:3-hydroxyacyl-CoA dehydrogenase NAD-binding domain-containing protein [Kribbella sp. VKM Ac-2569]RZT17718.1 3-hydroxyacyl-CoA dehydrogenase/enoyl-CoA hydratase/3-hydroxybutyryl-CoA epimerase [Kribbella sp. VKM Ac-2569]